jgi:RimJ/RimL family protein N-acetyltransferase
MRLRPPREEDIGAIAAACADPEIGRWTRVPYPYTREDASTWVALAEIARSRGSALHLLIAGADDDRLRGSIGVELRAHPAPHGELGYWVAADQRGHGVATRAARLLAEWALETLDLPRLEIHVLPENEPSREVARRAGFELESMRAIEFKGRIEEFEVYARVAHSQTKQNAVQLPIGD